MLGESKLVAFVATARPEEARHFYESTLGLALVEDGPFALVFEQMEPRCEFRRCKPFPGLATPRLGGKLTTLRLRCSIS